MFLCEGRYYTIESVKGDGARVVEATAAELHEQRDLGADIPGLGLPIKDVHACFSGPMLRRAQRIAGLSATRFSILFGTWGRGNPLYDHGRFLRRVGRRIPAPELPPHGGCGNCVTLSSVCGAGCARRIVHEKLLHATFAMLSAAVRHVEPIDQLEAAIGARVDSACTPRKRSRPTFAERRRMKDDETDDYRGR